MTSHDVTWGILKKFEEKTADVSKNWYQWHLKMKKFECTDLLLSNKLSYIKNGTKLQKLQA